MITSLTVYSFDPGFRHGALICSEFLQDHTKKEVYLAQLTPIFIWSQKTSDGIRADSPALEVFGFMEKILQQLSGFPPGSIIIDFDPKSVYWRPLKLQSVQLGIMVGYFSHGLLGKGFSTVFLTPREIRLFAGMKQNTKKEELHTWIRSQLDLSDFEGMLKNADVLDAVILSYVFASAIVRAPHERTSKHPEDSVSSS